MTRLVLLGELTTGDAGGPQAVELPKDEAITAVLEGRAVLHPRQDAPPWALLEEARKRAGTIDRIGPPTVGRDIALRIATEAVPNGVRQTFVGDSFLNWFHTSSKAEVGFRKQLLGPDGDLDSLSVQLGKSLAYRLNRKTVVEFDTKPDGDQLRESGIVELEERFSLDTPSRWYGRAIGRDWYEFRQSFAGFGQELNLVFVEALKAGRVLVVEELFPGGRLMHPEHWQHHSYDPTDYVNDHFLFSSSLPASWFGNAGDDSSHQRRRGGKDARGRPPGGGYARDDAPFVKMLRQRLASEPTLSRHQAVMDLVQQRGGEIKGASLEAKVRRLMKRLEGS